MAAVIVYLFVGAVILAFLGVTTHLSTHHPRHRAPRPTPATSNRR